MDKIRTAISIIDHLKSQIAFVNKEKTHVALTKDEIDLINREYNYMLNQKKFLLKTLNESHNKVVKEVENIKVPSIEYILMKEYGIKLSDDEDCKWCGKPCKNAAGISAHLKTCEKYLKSEQYQIDETKKKDDLEQKLLNQKKGKKNKNVILQII